jgi:hypothetical protein
MATSTALEVITDALHAIRVISEDEAPTAPQGVRSLRLLNLMMHGFNSKGIGYVHSDLALADTVNVPDEQVRNLGLMLARELAIEYGKTLGENLAASILSAENQFRAFYHKVRPARSEALLEGRWFPGGYVPLSRM